ncbi:hypothetical protein ACVIIW_003673 [Bradyrhizobium sp. USDA 4449]
MRLQQDRYNERRSLADAIDVLVQANVLLGARAGQIRVGGLKLHRERIVGLVTVWVERPDMTYLVSLPGSMQFLTKRQGDSAIETFDIFQLDGATFDSDGNVELTDGTRLRAVEVIPVLRAYEATELSIVQHTVAYLEAERECYRRPIWFQRPCLDCSALPRLRRNITLLKQIQDYIAKREPALEHLSEQKISDALCKFGMRIPTKRPRRLQTTSTM